MHSPNFEFLDDLIHSESKRICLDSDIVLESVEALNYIHGIKMDVDNLIMDGNGHTIDANHCARIFSVNGKKFLLKILILETDISIPGLRTRKKTAYLEILYFLEVMAELFTIVASWN